MLVAHVEREGVWSIDGGMHALALRTRRLRRCARRCDPLRPRGRARCSFAGGRACGVRLASGERIEADAVIINADVAAVAGGLFGSDARRAAAAIPPSARSLSAMTWSLVAKSRRLSAASAQRVFLAAITPPSSTTSSVAARCRASRPSMSARRTATTKAAPAPAEERLAGSRQRACQRRPACLRCSGGGTMRAADIWHAGAMRPADPATTRKTTRVTTPRGFQPAVSGDGRRALRPQFARMDGFVPASGSANPNSGIVSGGGQRASGTGGADGGAVRPLGGGQPAGGPRVRSAGRPKRLCMVVCRRAER